jgi:hypothetical protein
MSTIPASRYEHEAIDTQRTSEKFRVSSIWSLVVGSFVMCVMGAFWLTLDFGVLLIMISEAWSGDHAQLQRYGLAVFGPIFIAFHSLGGIMFLRCAVEIWCSPYRLILDGVHLTILSQPGPKRISIQDIQYLELKPNGDEAGTLEIYLHHSGGEVVIPMFKEYASFLHRLKIVCPKIEIQG